MLGSNLFRFEHLSTALADTQGSVFDVKKFEQDDDTGFGHRYSSTLLLTGSKRVADLSFLN